jgi:uncharacterized protein (TIGR02611 family)
MVREERPDDESRSSGVAQQSAPADPGRHDHADHDHRAERHGHDGHESSRLLEEVAEKLGFRDFLRRHRGLDVAYRAAVGVLGFAIIIAGIALIPLPGPGWLIVFAGLALLATEFTWAERLLHYGRNKLRSWTDWVGDQPLWVRGLIGLAGLALIAGLAWSYTAIYGVPGWLPVVGD